ncbi:hypothetical protein AVEN_212791-1 [Araneus ventricosus]|uniref:Uncharacterized protein n=1 Tax=Araneus ventricosus TaxID=182803 RepID=A0A4Y2WS40_ARAVE|nr:hypothetical protein AVEN_212791-1 [Araneus ventricosus]
MKVRSLEPPPYSSDLPPNLDSKNLSEISCKFHFASKLPKFVGPRWPGRVLVSRSLDTRWVCSAVEDRGLVHAKSFGGKRPHADANLESFRYHTMTAYDG